MRSPIVTPSRERHSQQPATCRGFTSPQPRKRAKRVLMRGVAAGRSAVYPEARLAARSGQRGTSGATTGGGGPARLPRPGSSSGDEVEPVKSATEHVFSRGAEPVFNNGGVDRAEVHSVP